MSVHQGQIVRFRKSGRDIRFFVVDPQDSIQSVQLSGGFYEQEELEIIEQFWRPDGAYVDIGSNVGNHAIYVEKFLGTEKVILFECNPIALDILRINLLLNGCRKVDDRYLGLAVGRGAGRADVVDNPYAHNLGGAAVRLSEGGKVPIISADEALASERVAFVKIDVEGMEMEVLAGMERTISRWAPNIFVEVDNRNSDQFFDWVGRSIYNIMGKVQRYPPCINYILTPK